MGNTFVFSRVSPDVLASRCRRPRERVHSPIALSAGAGRSARASRFAPRKNRPSATLLTMPAAVKRAVWERDRGQCAFVGAVGRCSARGFLEYHHIVPFADGGATAAENLALRCRAHNAYEADQWSGVTEEGLTQRQSGFG